MKKIISTFITLAWWAVHPVCLQAQIKEDLTAENILLWQRSYGGWPKDTYTVMADIKSPDIEPNMGKKVIDYSKEQSADQKEIALASKDFIDGTIDNEHTVKEIRYLLTAFKITGNQKYFQSAEKGVRYLFEAQYSNGGWPQFYPDRKFYRHQITFNDNAMVNVLNLMADIASGLNDTTPLKRYANQAKTAFNNGVDIILKTQITVHGKKTVWCAQYDEVTLQPEKARSYELPSLSGQESVGIVKVLMRIPNPSSEVKQAIEDALTWFHQSKITGFKTERIKDPSQPSGQDVVLKADPNAVIWARFYDIDTNKPFFCDRDGIKKNTLAEIGNERKTHYAWYGVWPAEMIEKDYPAWKKNLK
jgi:PelA/Pel-15E family pectate lyase